jgi:hypothetical protein
VLVVAVGARETSENIEFFIEKIVAVASIRNTVIYY